MTAVTCLSPVAVAVDFGREVRPILSDKCFLCHGPDEADREADLRLDEAEGIEYAFAEGDFEYSEAWRRITTDDPDEQMPPADHPKQLTPAERAVIESWMKEGADWSGHWAFETPRDPSIPRPKRIDWVLNEIDAFILKRIEAAGSEPSSPASKETLIRRLSFDLTGLPPTIKEIDAFLADDSPEAYEKLVDRLLASPKFGERMAADWLDLARYSDTFGYQVDRDRYVWPWRDWVIRAFNDNLPYDDFLAWQLAGDLYPNPTDDQILATTFNRLHPQKVEGGSIPEEFRVEYVADRVNTFATGMLGLTFECCRCHDHKYDPLPQRDYYSLYAFFNNIGEAGLYSYHTKATPTPTMSLLSDAEKQALDAARKRVQEAEQAAALGRTELQQAFDAWLAEESAALAQSLTSEAAPADALLQLDFEESPKAPNSAVPGVHGKAVQLTGDDAVDTKIGNLRRFQPFTVALWMNTPDEKERAVVYHRSKASTDAGSRGYQLLIEEGKLSASLIHFWPGNGIRVRTVDKLPIDQWTHVAVAYDGSSRAGGLVIYVDGKPAQVEVVRDALTKNITGGGQDHLRIGERERDRGFTNGKVDEFYVYERRLADVEIARLAGVSNFPAEPAQWTPQQRQAALQFFSLRLSEDQSVRLNELRIAREALCALEDKRQEIMVMRELTEVRPTYLLKRGAYDAPGEQLQPDTPAVLPSMRDGAPRNRLGLAQWLTDPVNPLTSRVAVNRLWQMIFGRGLVATSEDFGSQGTPPTHPELLDYLAVDFVESGWDVKRLLKRIVMSATYRQSSAVTEEALKKQPGNELLARSPRHRWPAEMLRDNALAVSGLLIDRIGGPPARPYELEASFKPVDRDQGDGLYRRSLYTYWKRTGPAPAMMTLDASKRDVCRVRRERTASPLQAIVLLNGPQHVEAARVLSQQVINELGDNADKLIVRLYRTLTSRSPSNAQLAVLSRLYDRQLAYFTENTDRADQFLSVGDAPRDETLESAKLAALTAVANTLMNYDECVRRH